MRMIFKRKSGWNDSTGKFLKIGLDLVLTSVLKFIWNLSSKRPPSISSKIQNDCNDCLKHKPILRNYTCNWPNNLFATSESPKYSNSNSPNLLLQFFCLIKSRASCSGITQPFLNLNLIFASNCLLQIH